MHCVEATGGIVSCLVVRLLKTPGATQHRAFFVARQNTYPVPSDMLDGVRPLLEPVDVKPAHVDAPEILVFHRNWFK